MKNLLLVLTLAILALSSCNKTDYKRVEIVYTTSIADYMYVDAHLKMNGNIDVTYINPNSIYLSEYYDINNEKFVLNIDFKEDYEITLKPYTFDNITDPNGKYEIYIDGSLAETRYSQNLVYSN